MTFKSTLFYGMTFLLGVSAAQADVGPLVTNADATIAVSGDDIAAEVSMMPPNVRMEILTKPDNVRRVSVNLLLRKALAKQGESMGLDKDGLVMKRLELAREKILAEARIQAADGESPGMDVLEKYARADYEANLESYRHPEQISTSHILIGKHRENGKALAEELLAKLKNGEIEFGKTAYQYSDDPGSKGKKGDLGFNAKGRMLPEFEEASWALKEKGDLSDVVETRFGWHIIRLDDHREAGTRPFEDVKEELIGKAGRKVVDNRRLLVTGPIEDSTKFNEEAIKAFAASHSAAP